MLKEEIDKWASSARGRCTGIDGGAIFTDNDEWEAQLRSLAVHGKAGNDKYNNIRLGLNSRLDTLQAAILLVKLKAFMDYEVRDINRVADMYIDVFKGLGLDDKIKLPYVKDGFYSSWAQFTIILPEGVDRDRLQLRLKEHGIPTMV